MTATVGHVVVTYPVLQQSKIYCELVIFGCQFLKIALKRSRNVTKVIVFMGLVGYYKRFIKGFSKIGHPITSLRRKGKNFLWSTECEASFQQLKHLLRNISWFVLMLSRKDSMDLLCKKDM
jgi:hypothetical protein